MKQFLSLELTSIFLLITKLCYMWLAQQWIGLKQMLMQSSRSITRIVKEAVGVVSHLRYNCLYLPLIYKNPPPIVFVVVDSIKFIEYYHDDLLVLVHPFIFNNSSFSRCFDKSWRNNNNNNKIVLAWECFHPESAQSCGVCPAQRQMH